VTKEDEHQTVEDLRHILGDIDDIKAAEILALAPTAEELEIAVLWAEGKEDIVATRGGTLSGKTAEIYEILTADEEDGEPPPVASG
jgi:hypothetical protein